MDPDRWQKVNAIFHAALEISSSERSRFISTASKGDAELQAEVELLIQADEDAGSYLESPLLPSPFLPPQASPLHPGDVLCQRFQIVRAVGEGGMGQVFEAFDSELAVRVALKVLRPEIASNPAALGRFRQEVRLARRITHPNACRTFDIQRERRGFDSEAAGAQAIVFLTMEFLEGETLAARIGRSGSLAVDEALQAARQIADGLQAAHAVGVIHRDMKPANIMLVPAGAAPGDDFRAVITDFGLARLDPVIESGNLSAFSHTARPIGTLAYMAPEQLEGKPVSAATDVYAYGLVLFEMVTGERAFPSKNLLSGITQRLTGSPPSPRTTPGVPDAWCDAIEGCLRVNPEERFQQVADACAVLEGGRTRLPFWKAMRQARLKGRLLHRRLMALWATFLIAVALFVGALRFYISRANPHVEPGALIYLAPVKNNTGVKAFDHLTELLRAGLSQSAQVNLLDEARVGDTLQHMTKSPDTTIDEPVGREIAMRNGAVRVVFASVNESGGRYRLDVDIQRPDSSPVRAREIWTKSFLWEVTGSTPSGTIPAGLLSAARSASDWIRREAGESKNDIAFLDAPPDDVTTGNWQALAEYAEALRLEGLGQQERAIEVLRNAVKLDPGFSLAYAKLGDTLLSIDRTQEGYEAYTHALDTDSLTRLTRRERDRIKGIYASDTEDFESAENAFRDYSTYYESDYLGWFYRGRPLKMLGRMEESVAVLRKALALAPSSVAAQATLANHLIVLGQFDEARQWVARLNGEGHSAEAAWRLGDIAFLEQRYDDAEAAYTGLSKSPELRFQSISAGMLARLSAERGDYSHAINLLNDGIAYDVAHGDTAQHALKLLDLAYLDLKFADYPKCIAGIEAALAMDSSPRAFLTASAILGQAFQQAPAAFSPLIRAELGKLQRQFPAADDGMISQLARTRLRAENLLASGDTAKGFAEFLKADALQAPADEREYLGRAYAIAAGKDPKSLVWSERMAKARDAYARFALRPGFAWDEALYHPPGFLADQTARFLHLAIATNHMDKAAIGSLAVFARLRPQEFNRSPDFQRALQQSPSGSAQPTRAKEIAHE